MTWRKRYHSTQITGLHLLISLKLIYFIITEHEITGHNAICAADILIWKLQTSKSPDIPDRKFSVIILTQL
jgi:hypothetical protein